METGVYIPIISDYGFKATFGNETDSLFLRTALQALIKSDTPIREVHFDKNAFEALTIDSRSGIFDLACTDENGSQFIVEMQLGQAPHFIQRMKFYALHKFNTVVERGEFDCATVEPAHLDGRSRPAAGRPHAELRHRSDLGSSDGRRRVLVLRTRCARRRSR